MTDSELDQATLELLDRSIEVDMRTPRRDGSESSRPIWVVVADGVAYVRSYLGEQGAWYRRALADGRANIAVQDTVVDFFRGADVGGRHVTSGPITFLTVEEAANQACGPRGC